MARIIIYTKSYCPYCKRALDILDTLNNEYTNIEVDNGSEEFEKLKQELNYRMVPIIIINGKFIGGCNELEKLNDSGELEELINE